MRKLELYIHFIKLGFMEMVAYRITILMLLLSVPIILFARYFVFAALYEQPDQLIEGYKQSEILTYLICVWLLRGFFRSGTDRRIGRDVRSGQIVFDLLRPVHYMSLTFFRGLGKSLNRLLIITLPLLFVFLVTDLLQTPDSLFRYAAFSMAVFFGYILSYEIQFIVGVSSFYTGYNIGLIWTFEMISQILAGLLVPLHFFPDTVFRIIQHLPFRHIFYTPAEILMGRLPEQQIIPEMMNAFLWVFGMGCLSIFMFSRARHKLSIAGG